MFGWQRKSDGFQWVDYVPTQVRQRRERRRQKLAEARIEVQGLARHAARQARVGTVAALLAAGVAVRRGLVAFVIGTGNLVIALTRAGQPIVATLGRALALLAARLTEPQVLRFIGMIGVLVVLGGIVRIVGSGADSESRIALGAGALAIAAAVLPIVWRQLAPPLARKALASLQTQRPGLGIATRRHIGRAAPAALGMLLLGALAGGGWWAAASLIAPPKPITGRASAATAEIIKIGEREVRLTGIAAPMPEQKCGEASKRWRCGEAAQRALASLVRGKSLECTLTGSDGTGRASGRCRIGERDLAAELVREGHVWADQRDRGGYRKLETAAREAKSGVWRSPSAPPWEWRQQLWEEAKRQAPEGCPVKGEVARGASLYHMPWSPSYERIRIVKPTAKDKLKGVDAGGRRWFCSEKEALDAGFKPAPDGG